MEELAPASTKQKDLNALVERGSRAKIVKVMKMTNMRRFLNTLKLLHVLKRKEVVLRFESTTCHGLRVRGEHTVLFFL